MLDTVTESHWQSFLYILKGLPLSLGITLVALFFGFVIAAISTAILTLREGKPSAYLTRGFILFFTGTPLLVQLFLIYFGPGQFEAFRESIFMVLFAQAWFCAVLTFSLNSAAYTTQIFHGAMKNISPDQWKACLALGMSRFEAFKILFPLALRRAIPTYSNEIVLVFKGTSLVSTIALLDIIGRVNMLVGFTYDQLTYYLMAGAIYIVVNGLLIILAKVIEQKALSFQN